jgi:hypothetical protein
MYRPYVAVVLAAAGLALAAPSALAEARFNGPNCTGGAVSQNVTGIGVKEAAANLGLTVQEAQALIDAACANITTNPPRCEIGHGEAAQRALERGDLDQYMFHLGALQHCFLGQPAGPPL